MIKYTPRTAKILEKVINEPLMSRKANKYFEIYKEWFTQYFSQENMHEGIIILNSLCKDFYYYFHLLKKYSTNIERFEFLNPNNCIFQGVSYDSAKAMFNALAKVFSFCDDSIGPIRLRDNLTFEEIKTIYEKYTDVYTSFVKEMHDMEVRLIYKHSMDWSLTLRARDLECLSLEHFSQELSTSQTFPKPRNNKLLLVRPLTFSTKINFNSNELIKAKVLKMNSELLESHGVFGLLYNSDINEFIANNHRNNSNYKTKNKDFVTIKDIKKADVDASVFLKNEGCIVDYDSVKENLLPEYAALPINSVNEILNNPEVLNTVTLSPNNEPFAIFIWEDNLQCCINQVRSLNTLTHLPILVSKRDGSVDLLSDLDQYLSL